MVMVLFNLIVPIGWQLGIVRLEDVLLGCLVSVVVGALFWPKGTRKLIRGSLAAIDSASRLQAKRAHAAADGLGIDSGDAERRHRGQDGSAGRRDRGGYRRIRTGEAELRNPDLAGRSLRGSGVDAVGQLMSTPVLRAGPADRRQAIHTQINEMRGWYERFSKAIEDEVIPPPSADVRAIRLH